VLVHIQLVSFEARDLVQKMMEPDPKNRISAEDALKHPWIVNGTMHPPNVATLSAGGEEPTDVHCSIS
jgi:serine/threonine protein kinase